MIWRRINERDNSIWSNFSSGFCGCICFISKIRSIGVVVGDGIFIVRMVGQLADRSAGRLEIGNWLIAKWCNFGIGLNVGSVNYAPFKRSEISEKT